MQNKLYGFPIVNYISLKECVERRESLESNFIKNGVTTFNALISDRFSKCSDIVTGNNLENMTEGEIGCAVSHIKAIKYWYDNTTEPYGFFCEDDLSLETIEFWEFTWKEFIEQLPNDWDCVQLLCIRNEFKTFLLKKRSSCDWLGDPIDWGAAAYILKRDYAKKILNNYFVNDNFLFYIKEDLNTIPSIENLLFTHIGTVYTIPLFVEDVSFDSTFTNKQKSFHEYSREKVLEWWKKNLTLKPIPVVGTAVVKSTVWVSRLISSIDYPVETFVIINNNGKKEINKELDLLAELKHEFIRNIVVCHMPSNIGVAGAWNLIIKCFMNAPYWIIVNDDVSFGPGLLKEMHNACEADPEIGIIHAYEGDFNMGSWDLFLIRDHTIQNYGLFDENLYPAYTEDSDYIMRFIIKPVKNIVSLPYGYKHGLGEKDQYYTEGRQTSKTSPELKEKLDKSNNMNIDYLSEKWGEGWRMGCPYKNPYNQENNSLSHTTYDLSFVRKKHLGF